MLRRLTLCAALALAAPAAAQQPASMSADQAYVRAVTLQQAQYGKLSGDQAELKALLTVALAELNDLKTRAKAQDAVARSTLNDFAQGNTAKGVDALFVQAKAKAEASAAQSKAATEDYKAAGALAFASDTNRAVTAYREALKLAPEDADTLQQLWWLYYRLGRYDESLVLADKLAASTEPAAKARGLLDRGNVLEKRGDLVGSEIEYKAALDVALKAGLPEREAQALHGRGIVSYRRGDLADAEYHFRRALVLLTKLDSREPQARVLTGLGVIAWTRGDLAGAEDYQKRALALNTELGRKEGQAYDLNSLGYVARDRGNIAGACDYFRKSLALSESMGAPNSAIGNQARNNIAQSCPR